MPRPPVPLNALRAFEAAARRLSVRHAAEELSVSPSAVSHQVRQLEAILGTSLFIRNGRGIQLSDDAVALLPKLTSAFALIEAAVDEHQANRVEGPLRLSVLDTFAHWWLLPRLSSYPLTTRGFELDIQTTLRAVNFETENIDAAIRIGHGDWAGAEAVPLFTERLGVYGAPRLNMSQPPLILSRHREAEWRAWCESPSPPAAAHQLVVLVESASLALKAALDGVGLCLAGDVFAELQTRAGLLKLHEACPHLSTRGGYWLVFPRRLQRDLRFRNFRNWLVKQVEDGATANLAGDAAPQGA